jgi:hypothetical protein
MSIPSIPKVHHKPNMLRTTSVRSSSSFQALLTQSQVLLPSTSSPLTRLLVKSYRPCHKPTIFSLGRVAFSTTTLRSNAEPKVTTQSQAKKEDIDREDKNRGYSLGNGPFRELVASGTVIAHCVFWLVRFGIHLEEGRAAERERRKARWMEEEKTRLGNTG